MVGNIGSGKSTLVKQMLEKNLDYIAVSKDAIRYMIGGGTYKFDFTLEKFVKESELKTIESFMASRKSIIVDDCNINKAMRQKYIELAKKYAYTTTAIIMPQLKKHICLERRLAKPHGKFSKIIWSMIWHRFNLCYQKPVIDEGIDCIIQYKGEECLK